MKTIKNHTKMYLLVFLLIFISCNKENIKEELLPYPDGSVSVAKWQGNKKACLLLQFDDSTEGQALYGVPSLNERNLVGTWHVNPGNEKFNKYRDYWEKTAPEGGQELANHTMTHTGASNYDEVVYEVGEAAKIIWRIRKESELASLIAFNRGGGTSWNEDDLTKVLKDFKNIDRQSYLGVKNTAISIQPGEDANKMFEIIPQVIADSAIGSIHFHGIAADDGNPPMDGGHAAVWINEFNTFLDKVVGVKDDIWNCGYIQAYKYIKEFQTHQVSIGKYNDNKLAVQLSSEMDAEYYNEALTVIAKLPDNWKSCNVSQDGKESTYNVQNGILLFNALPNRGEIIIINK